MNINELERLKLIEFFDELPVEFFSRMRHLQPQIGCLNCCSICSKFASTNSEYWTKEQIANVAYALKEVAKKYKNDKPFLVWNREEHRPGVIFSYLDNDIGSYPYLDLYLESMHNILGVKTRISTVGFSRHNNQLNDVHKRVNDHLLESLGGVRLSFTPYAIGWKNNNSFSKEEYALDIANFLNIYKKYYDYAGSGNRKMCVEIRYKPLTKYSEVLVTNIDGYFVIVCDKYLFVSVDKDIHFDISQINDPYDHSISINNNPILFNKYYLKSCLNENEISNIIYSNFKDNRCLLLKQNCKAYMFENKEGIYYTFDPHIEKEGCYGIQVYPYNEIRQKSGYLITERYFLNILLKYVNTHNIDNATWDNVDEVFKLLEDSSKDYYDKGLIEVSKYIKEEVEDMLRWYSFALKKANYSPKTFFDPNFTIDTGIICNMGKAYSEFRNITSRINEPLTPTHERNYGIKMSTMTKEGSVWRLSCDFNNKILVEKLQLGNTASSEGQVCFSKKIDSLVENERVTYNKLKEIKLIPGQRGDL